MSYFLSCLPIAARGIYTPLSRDRRLKVLAWAIAPLFAGVVRGEPVDWLLDSDGNWNTPSAWSTGAPPGALDDVALSRPGSNPLITFSSGTQSIRSLVVDDRLTITGGTLNLGTAAQINNMLTLSGGVISGGTLNFGPSSTLSFGTTTGTTLHNTVFNAPLNLSTSGAKVTLSGASRVNGPITLSGSGARLTVGTGIISGEVRLAAPTANTVYLTGSGTDAFASAANIHGTGSITGSVSNAGLISADVSGRGLSVATANFLNTGTLEARNGGNLAISGTFINSGTLQALPGSAITLYGTWANANNSQTITPATGTLNISGATLQGGTFNIAPGSSVAVASPGFTLDSTKLNGDLALTVPNSTLRVANGSSLTGTVSLISTPSAFLFDAVSATGTAAFAAAVPDVTTSPTLTLRAPASGVITGETSVIRGGFGRITSTFSGSALVTHLGTISADVAGAKIRIGNTALLNRGILEACNGGTLEIASSLTNQGTLRALPGSAIRLSSDFYPYNGITFTNTDKNLTFGGPEAGTLSLFGVRVVGGTLNSINNGINFEDVAYLDNTTYNGNLTLTRTAVSQFTNNTRVNGPVSLQGGAILLVLGGSSLNGPVTLSGDNSLLSLYNGALITDTVTIIGPSSRLAPNTNDTTVTVTPTGTIQGGRNGLPSAVSSTGYGSTGYANFAIINNGTLLANVASRPLSFDGVSVTNSGLAVARNGGTLFLQTLTNLSADSEAILRGGTYRAEVGSTIQLGRKWIKTLAADVQLHGAGSFIHSGWGPADAFTYFSDITPAGKLTLTGGRTLILANDLSSEGSIHIGTASALTFPLTNGTYTGTLTADRLSRITGFGSLGGNLIQSGLLAPTSDNDASPTAKGRLSIFGSLTASPTAVTHFDIAGSTAGTYDTVQITGPASLAGTFVFDFATPFAPTAGQTFTFVSAGSVTLDPATTFLPLGIRSDWQFSVSTANNALTLTSLSNAVSLPHLPGDYNRDGLVDAADYTVWADTFAATGYYLPADGNNDGVVDAADYTIWADGFGTTSSSFQTNIPEATTVLPLLGASGLLRRRRH